MTVICRYIGAHIYICTVCLYKAQRMVYPTDCEFVLVNVVADGIIAPKKNISSLFDKTYVNVFKRVKFYQIKPMVAW